MPDDASNSQPNTPLERKTSAVKDKECPFCGQFFTQSSLGRHLDQWIKPDNPKEADGKHDVEQIKKIRGKVTRRTMGPKAPPKRTLTPASSKGVASEAASPTVPIANPFNPPALSRTNTSKSNPSPLSLSVPKVRKQTARQASRARQVQLKTDLDERQKAAEEQDNVKAVELALKEVLQNVQSACSRSALDGLFDFDPFTLSFPALCLHILPAPSGLDSVTPFVSKDSWSIDPPGRQQLDALQRYLKDRLEQYQQFRQLALLTPRSSLSSNSPPPTPPASGFDVQKISKLHTHVDGAYKTWERLGQKEKQQHWQLEILRCHARTAKSRDSLQNQLADARREIAQLKAQPWKNLGMDAVQYTEMAVKAYASSFKVPVEAVRDMNELGVGAKDFDYDHLIGKWRNKLQEVRDKSRGLSSQRALSDTITNGVAESTRSSSNGNSEATSPRDKSDIQVSAQLAAPTIQNVQDTIMDDDDAPDDQEDASGEDEDADGDIDIDETPEDISPQSQMPSRPLPQKFEPPHIHPQQTQHPPQMQQQQQQQQQQQTQANQMQQRHAMPQHMIQQHMQPNQMMWDPSQMQRRSSHPNVLPQHTHLMNHQQLAMIPMEHLDFSNRGMMHASMQEMYSGLGGPNGE